MKKQTNNTFEGGLLLDTHPLTTPNNVLTDALNATLITMNGNEGILQNDMGNGRVESAFLPPGYVPVGMKEYGGIIYVASYNPVTNKSQIGSFPSPERNIDQTEVGDRGTTLQLLWDQYKRIFKNNDFNSINYNIGIGGFTNKIQIFDKVIRSGDKFGLYFDGHDNNKNQIVYLSNYFNYTDNTNRGDDWDSENNVYKNDIITLSVQVLDANNNLRDITPQLKRYDNQNKLINFDDKISEQDKFNSGYFINNANPTEISNVDIERNKRALNTYNNKLFGKLFLTGVVNVIDHIESYVRFKTKIEEQDGGSIEKKVIEFNINYYYNCKEEYLYPPKIVYKFDNNEGIECVFGKEKNESDITYDSITNLYKKEYIREIEYNSGNKIFNYVIIPTMQKLPETTSNQPGCEIDNNKVISKLVHIATEGYIDLEKVGKGFEKINEWRYRYLGDYMQLNLGLEYYPLEDDKLSNLRLVFTNIGDSSTFQYTFPDKISYNGTFTAYLNFNNDFKYGQLYKVEILVKENRNSNKKLGERILISTEIYNDLFTQVYDYCDDESLDLILEKNEVVLDLNIEELAYSNSGLKNGSVINLIYNDNSYTGTGATQFSMFGNGDNELHGIIKQYDATVNQNIKVSFDIPSKFPFKFSNIDQINYNLQVKAETTKPVLKSGTYDLPILDKQYNVPIKSVINGNINDVYTEQTSSGEKVCNIETKYFFYSELAYKYDSSKSPVIPRYIYTYRFNTKEALIVRLNTNIFFNLIYSHFQPNN